MGAVNKVEHRWSQRHETVLAVDVYSEGIKLCSCHTRDVGLGGVFLEAVNGQPPQALDVELIFKLCEVDSQIRYKLNAHVVRVVEDGIGLMFKDFDTGAFRALQEIIRHTADSH